MHTLAPILTIDNLEEHMVSIPAGSFERGEGKERHTVHLDSFYLCRYPVGQVLWQEVIGENPAYFADPLRSVSWVSWDNCTQFLERLNAQNESTYRLPTEAEWDYAARGGCNFSFSGSSDREEIAWYNENSQGETHLGGCKRPNTFGLFDMSGNIDEWCQDWYNRAYFQYCAEQGIQHGPLVGPDKGSHKVVKGGSGLGYFSFLRVSYRDFLNPTFRGSPVGMRLCKSIA
ncbi:MAG: formylglycine-generating enzyme family protein [Bacteroidota bacterium]